MVSQIQYGGKITDDFDMLLMDTYAEKYFHPGCLKPGFELYTDERAGFSYRVPDGADIDVFRSYIETLPGNESPEIFGLHPNADLTFRALQVQDAVATILDTMPKGGGGGGGLSREEIVDRICEDLLGKCPPVFDAEETKERCAKLPGGPTMPLTVTLRQEIDRLNIVIRLTKGTLQNLRLAIAGSVALSGDLVDALAALFNARIPPKWLAKSWEAATLGNWFTGLLQRYDQLAKWVNSGRPKSYWLTGFFNPQARSSCALCTAVQLASLLCVACRCPEVSVLVLVPQLLWLQPGVAASTAVLVALHLCSYVRSVAVAVSLNMQLVQVPLLRASPPEKCIAGHACKISMFLVILLQFVLQTCVTHHAATASGTTALLQGFLTAMKQEVNRRHAADKWALDDVVMTSAVTHPAREFETLKDTPAEGVYVHGLFLDGAAWSKGGNKLVDAEPKELYNPLPVLHVTGVQARDKPKKDIFECPTYRVKKRTGLNFITTFALRTEDPKSKWVLRGAALLCSKD